MKIKKGIILLLISLFLMGMAEAPSKTSVGKIDKISVEAILSQIESVYEREDIPSFRELLDKNFENYLSFVSQLESYFSAVKFLNLYLVLDTYLEDKDKALVRLHWFKKSINNSGVFSKSAGSSVFAFRNTPTGLKLLYIREDNPFF
ncbi:MAG: hypothetical protein NC936_04360 [Candidatus Omnitrophica bacterium]|nr:hypothetical protein [Candidatus Omnitrophota bacterium]